MTAATMTPATAPPTSPPHRRRGKRGWVFHAVMGPVAVLWVLPLVFVILVAVRSFDDIAQNGLGTWPQSFSLAAFRTAWVDGDIGDRLAEQRDRHGVHGDRGAVLVLAVRLRPQPLPHPVRPRRSC